LKLFNIDIDSKTQKFLKNHWPDRLSVILDCNQEKFKYLHRGTNTLAFRLPKKPDLIDILKETGPLISTSVNPEGLEPAKNIQEAKNYFGNKLDFYVEDASVNLISSPSTVIKIDSEGKVEIVRQGIVKIT